MQRNSRSFNAPKQPKCRDNGPGVFTCSLKPGHSGPHIALGEDGEPRKMWVKENRRVRQ